MTQHIATALTTAVLLCVGTLSGASQFPAQQKSLKDQLVGTWTIVSVDNTLPNGTKRRLFGVDPNGIIMFNADGRFAQIQMRSSRSKFRSNNRLEASGEESKTAMMDTLAQFGTWSVSEAAKVIMVHVEHALIPNAESLDSNRIIISLTADELIFRHVGPSTGGQDVSAYRRAK